MASAAERRRRRRAKSAAAANENYIRPEPTAPNSRPPRPRLVSKVELRADGLDFLLQRQRISRSQFDVGRIYGTLYRASIMEGSISLRSCLDIVPAGGGGGGLPAGIDDSCYIAECKLRLDRAHGALGFHAGMIDVCDLICGRGMRPRDITTVQRDSEQIETGLRLALDLLGQHFRDERQR